MLLAEPEAIALSSPLKHTALHRCVSVKGGEDEIFERSNFMLLPDVSAVAWSSNAVQEGVPRGCGLHVQHVNLNAVAMETESHHHLVQRSRLDVKRSENVNLQHSHL